jgi:hypothetical protein
MSLIAAVYNAVLSLRKRTWSNGMSVRQYEVVKSPLDHEEYERITAAGGGSTDPSLDTTNYVARSYKRTLGLPNIVQVVGSTSLASLFKGSTTTSLGVIAVGTRTLALSLTGRGQIDFLAALKQASGTFRIEVLVDTRVVCDETVTMGAASNAILVIGTTTTEGSGTIIAAIAVPDSDGVQFKKSLQVYVTPVATASGAACGIGYIAKSHD